MLELKFVKEGSGIPQVRVYLHRPVEPLSGLGYFTLAPEQPVGKSRRELINSLTLEEDANPQKLQLKRFYRCSNSLLSQEGNSRFLGNYRPSCSWEAKGREGED